MFKIYLDIGPLQEREFTGISQVTAKSAEELLGDPNIEPGFVYADLVVPTKVVENLLRYRDGSFFRYHFCSGDLRYPSVRSLDFLSNDPIACLYPNVKTSRGLYPVEAQIIHDLSTLLAPEYHTRDTIQHHAYTLAADLASNDLTFCVSEATRSDVMTYFGVPKDRTAVCYLGADLTSTLSDKVESKDTTPYILVLGTLEPRKNLDLMFQMLKKHRELSEEYKIVVVGRVGWGEGIQATVHRAGIADLWESGRLQFLGYVSEREKAGLIQNATLMVYPSMFEGFGLPVLEALVAGTPVVTTFSSSLPEVGGEVAYYCDPADADSLWVAILRALGDIASQPDAISAACKAQASRFSWEQFYQSITMGLLEAHRQKFSTRSRDHA